MILRATLTRLLQKEADNVYLVTAGIERLKLNNHFVRKEIE